MMKQLELVFRNENGAKYVWHPTTLKEDPSIETGRRLLAEISAIELGRPYEELEDSPWQGGAEPRLVELAPKKKKKKNEKPDETSDQPDSLEKSNADKIKELLNSLKEPIKRKAPKRAWLFTPAEVERLKHETLIRRLQKHLNEGGKADVFLGYARMLKAIYNNENLTVTGKITRQDLYLEMRAVYNKVGAWTEQMITSLPEFSYLFTNGEWAQLHKEWKKQKKARDKKDLTATITETSDEDEKIQEVTAEEKKPVKSGKRRKKTKELVRLMKNLNGENNRPKPKRDFFMI